MEDDEDLATNTPDVFSDSRRASSQYRGNEGNILSHFRNLNTMAMNSISSLFTHSSVSKSRQEKPMQFSSQHHIEYQLQTLRNPSVLSSSSLDSLEPGSSTTLALPATGPTYHSDLQHFTDPTLTPRNEEHTDIASNTSTITKSSDHNSPPSFTFSLHSSGSELDSAFLITPETSGLLAPVSTALPSSPADIRGFGMFYESPSVPTLSEDILMQKMRMLEVREGKKPQRSAEYDSYNDGSAPQISKPQAQEDVDDWYGLQYTLELSCKEQRASEVATSSTTGGEHSRSRESWAAIHRGLVHPYYEDEEYNHWKSWHQELDRREELRKHRKGIEFAHRAHELALVYLDEVNAWEYFYLQLEEQGFVDDEVHECLDALSDCRPDPYYPPRKHDQAWFLRPYRSIACLRELVDH